MKVIVRWRATDIIEHGKFPTSRVGNILLEYSDIKRFGVRELAKAAGGRIEQYALLIEIGLVPEKRYLIKYGEKYLTWLRGRWVQEHVRAVFDMYPMARSIGYEGVKAWRRYVLGPKLPVVFTYLPSWPIDDWFGLQQLPLVGLLCSYDELQDLLPVAKARVIWIPTEEVTLSAIDEDIREVLYAVVLRDDQVDENVNPLDKFEFFKQEFNEDSCRRWVQSEVFISPTNRLGVTSPGVVKSRFQLLGSIRDDKAPKQLMCSHCPVRDVCPDAVQEGVCAIYQRMRQLNLNSPEVRQNVKIELLRTMLWRLQLSLLREQQEGSDKSRKETTALFEQVLKILAEVEKERKEEPEEERSRILRELMSDLDLGDEYGADIASEESEGADGETDSSG